MDDDRLEIETNLIDPSLDYPINLEYGSKKLKECSEIITGINGKKYKIIYLDKYGNMTLKEKAVDKCILELENDKIL